MARAINDNVQVGPAYALAEAIVNSSPAINVFAACEWDWLSDDGKVWLATIVGEAVNRTGGVILQGAVAQ